jgi:hypothetical protein
MRNYAILSICADESRIFRTKERAPVMLTLEVYRPIELTLLKRPLFAEMAEKLEKEGIENEKDFFDANPRVSRKISKSYVGDSSIGLFNPFTESEELPLS